jgi:creatinine amidohydrolase
VNLLPTATSVDEGKRAASIAVLPVGSFEQHGDHLPLATDSMIAVIIAGRVADAYGLFQLPPITISCSHEHAGWPGTVSISATTLHAVIVDVAASLAASGIQRLLLVSGHGGNYVLSNVAQEASVTGPHIAVFPTPADWRSARVAADLSTDPHTDMHAGELETSILLHALPEVVRPSYPEADHTAERPQLLTLGLRAYTSTGVIGVPSQATAEKGKALLDQLVADAAEHLRALGAPHDPRQMDVDDLPRAEFAFPGPLRDRLVAAILSGAKTSTSGLVRFYERENEPLPEVGRQSAVVDSRDRPVAVIELTEVRVVRLAEIDLQHVLDEGEGDETVAQWRAGHETFWHSAEVRAELGEPGFTVNDDTLVLAQRFRLVSTLTPR